MSDLRRLGIAAIASWMCLFAPGIALAQTEDYAAWNQFRVFSINTAVSNGGANVGGLVAGFPLLVRLTAANASDVFAQAKSGGADLRFRRAVGLVLPPIVVVKQGAQAMQTAVQAVETDPQLPYEIAHWDSAGKTAEIWVLVDTIYGNRSNQYIAMHWGKSDAPARSTPAAVFDSSKGFVSVWHMGGISPSANRSNAVAGGNPAVPSGLNVTTGFPVRTGVIGLADTLRGGTGTNATARANDDHFNLGSGYANFSAGMTMSLWLKPASPATTAWNVFYAFGNGAPGDNLTIGRMGNSTTLWGEVYEGTFGDGRVEMNEVLAYNQWQMVTFTVQANYQELSHNGGQTIIGLTKAVTVPNVTRTMAYLGRSIWADPSAAGAFDEVRLYKVRRSANEIKLDYETQKPGSTVLAVVAPPSVPSLTAPAANATGLSIFPAFQWSMGSSTIGVTYRVQIATDSLFTAPILDSVQTAINLEYVPVSFNTTYFWRVRSKTDMGTSAWSTVRRFTTEATPTGVPVAPTLVTPQAFATAVALSPTLMWQVPAGAVSFHLQVATNSSFAGSSLPANDSGIMAIYRKVSSLTGSAEHYWRVRAKNVHGVSPWSDVRAFTTAPSVPTAPTLLSPDAFATGIPTGSPNLSWSALQGAASYRVQVSPSSDFATFVSNDTTTATSRTLGNLAGLTHYYWRVNAKNSAGTSAYSEIRRFTTGEPVALLPYSSGFFSVSALRVGEEMVVRLSLPRAERVTVRWRDLRGRLSAPLRDEMIPAGSHNLRVPGVPIGVGILEIGIASSTQTLLIGP